MKTLAAFYYRVDHSSVASQSLLRNLDILHDHRSIEGSLAFNRDHCSAYSERGS